MRQQRILDLSVLDHVSWPEYMWEWLRLKGALMELCTVSVLFVVTGVTFRGLGGGQKKRGARWARPGIVAGDTLAEKQWVFPEEAQGSPEASKAIERFSKVRPLVLVMNDVC